MADEPDSLVLELLRRMREDMNSMKSDLTSMKSDLTSMKSDLTSMKSDLTSMKSDIHSIKRDVHAIKHVQVSHTLKLDYLEENFEIVVEGTKSAMSGASGTIGHQLRTDKLLAELTQRVERLERAE